MKETSSSIIVGIDEAGRGAFFGRIYSAAVVHDPSLMETALQQKLVIRDSKKMTPRQRSVSRQFLEKHAQFGIGWCDEKEIDTLGITKCNILCMHRALDDLLSKYPSLVVDKIHVDGVLFAPYHSIPFQLVAHGEDTHEEIAMASILAKTLRDEWVVGLCDQFPDLDEKYHLRNNKGYGTKQHIKGLRTHGPHPSHRRSFLRNYCPQLKFL